MQRALLFALNHCSTILNRFLLQNNWLGSLLIMVTGLSNIVNAISMCIPMINVESRAMSFVVFYMSRKVVNWVMKKAVNKKLEKL